MRERYLEKLEQLHKELLEMGLLCEKAIMKTYRLLLSEEERQGLVTRIDALEREIDAKERMIESICMQLFLQQQPVASDLRRITAALKLITDLERIGDQTTDIAEIMQTGSVTVTDQRCPPDGNGRVHDEHGKQKCGILCTEGSFHGQRGNRQ